MPEAGGADYSIPAYRMPKSVMVPVTRSPAWHPLRVGRGLGGDAASLRDLRSVTRVCSWHRPLDAKSLRLEKGELLDSGLKFLIGVQVGGRRASVGERVLVIGGGSVAVDVALTGGASRTRVSMAA